MSEIINDSNLPENVEGYYDKEKDKIHISTRLTVERRAEVIKHELEHANQSKSGKLPTKGYVNPCRSIKAFMDYFSDPSEVSARAAETSQPIPEIWDEVFKLKNELYEPAPLHVDKIVPNKFREVVPEKPLPSTGDEFTDVHNNTEWQFRRLTGQLKPNDPKPKLVESKSIRIYFGNGGNGIIAASLLRNKGIKASSVAPFSVDVPLTTDNITKIQSLAMQTPLLTECMLKIDREV